MDWAERRKLVYIFCTLVTIGAILAFIYYRATNVAPTCFDNKRNADEVGVDCGGVCSRYCANELQDPKIRWVRTFPVTEGIVHAVAYIEHSYPTAAAENVGYTFRLYDDKNTLISERKGTTFLGPMGKSAIVDTLIPVGNTPVSVVRFAFNQPVPWEKISGLFSSVVIKTDRTVLDTYEGGTRLSATLDNTSRYNFTNMEVVAILYDTNGNAITASKSLLPTLKGLSSKVVYFTWPYVVQGVSRMEVIPRFNPFTVTEL